ncbi:tyrosine-type recombinase/integrase [Burkholderia sp. MBR-1]|uniref:tyrosine-type recombinase/integrase n=1 Tax=Burkholderia sp. MBR-1 TaxID=2732364 RepID=UPI0015EE7F34|nr:tyrosine-type recombinase/integrase [Burkholderia sp. MBR-1]QMI49911.1 tyrosine-type recombinase/integrase [Burkholderia sp. MBR-1]
MNPSEWFDLDAVPPAPLPDTVEGAFLYLEKVLGHVIYRRWTIQAFVRGHASVLDARDAHPEVYAALVTRRHNAVIEYWRRGCAAVVPIEQAPPPHEVLLKVLRSRRRFGQASSAAPGINLPVSVTQNVSSPRASALAVIKSLSELDLDRAAPLRAWLSRTGRFARPGINQLPADNDADAIAVFLRDRASRSRHTARAYVESLKRFIGWCESNGLGPLSDLTRDDILQYRHWLETSAGADGKPVGEATRTRALAVVASIYAHWQSNGYLQFNPALDLTRGAAARTGFVPGRKLPAQILAECDRWVASCSKGTGTVKLESLRRRAIWTLFRLSGVRLAELVWDERRRFPKVEAHPDGNWTLQVYGKGGKVRQVQLPKVAQGAMSEYRQARGLPGVPLPDEVVPLFHGAKGGVLRGAGIYREVKTIFREVADELKRTANGDPQRLHAASLLAGASPHWLRHAYARMLVIDNKLPLPVAQELLGHASIQTTAAYARNDSSAKHEILNGIDWPSDLT